MRPVQWVGYRGFIGCVARYNAGMSSRRTYLYVRPFSGVVTGGLLATSVPIALDRVLYIAGVFAVTLQVAPRKLVRKSWARGKWPHFLNGKTV